MGRSVRIRPDIGASARDDPSGVNSARYELPFVRVAIDPHTVAKKTIKAAFFFWSTHLLGCYSNIFDLLRLLYVVPLLCRVLAARQHFHFRRLFRAMAQRRIALELKALEKEPISGCTAKPKGDGSNIMKWSATIQGPPDSPYEGGTFRLGIQFPKDYPFKPPTIIAKTRIFHPNIMTHICLDILDTNWSPLLNISKVLLSIASLLCDPNPDSALNEAAAKLYKNNRQEFDNMAREYTQKYAME